MLLGLILAATFAASPAFAANQIFVRFSTTNLAGESTATGHVGDIDVSSFSWGVQRSGGTGAAQDLLLTKRSDKTSPNLMLSVFSGTRHTQVKLFVRNGPLDFLTITLTNVLITGYNTAASPDGVVESIGLSFDTVSFSYQAQNPDGSASGGAVTAGWNIVQARAL